MSWKEDANRRFAYIKRARNGLAKALASFNRAIYTTALERILGLNTDAGGKLIVSTYNITYANQTGLVVQQQIQRENRTLFDVLIRGMKRLFGLNTSYFGNMGDLRGVDLTAEQKLFLSYGYDVRQGTLIAGGYFAESLAGNPAAGQIVKLMNDAINAKMTLAEFRRTFKQFFQPAGANGAIERHFLRWSGDFYQQFDRLAQLEFKDALGLSYAIYAGTIVDDSREFCMARNNLLYTEPEILLWNGQDWQGKIPGMDVRIACGGYNCRHSLNWISDELAETLIQRGAKLNKYQ